MRGARPTEEGFTLIEVLVGIAVSSILIIAVFQFLSRIITFREAAFQRGVKVHKKVSVVQILHQDLMSVPVGEMDFTADRDEFSRRTVTHETVDGRSMDTLVQYGIREEDGKEHLYRRWKWSEIHDQFQKELRLVSAEDITLQYKSSDGRWARNLVPEEHPRAVRIRWEERTITTPVASERRKF